MTKSLRILSYFKPYGKQILLNILFNLIHVFSQVFSLVLVAPFVGILFGLVKPVTENPGLSLNFEQTLNWFYFHVTQMQQSFGTFAALLFVAGLFVVFSFFSGCSRYLGMFYLTPLRNGLVMQLRNELFQKMLSLPLSFFSEQRRGDLIARVTNDTSEIDWATVKALQSIIKDFLNMVVFLVVLFGISTQLTLVALIIFPPTVYVISIIGKSLKRNSDRLQNKMGSLFSIAEESISGLRMIKSYEMFDLMNDRFSAIQEDYVRYGNRFWRRFGLSNPITELFIVIAAVCMIGFGGSLVLSQKMNAEVLITFLVLFFRLLPPAKAFAGAFFLVQRGRAALQRIFEILDAQQTVEEAKNPVKWTTFKDSICYKNVSFAYESDPQKIVLNSISLELKKGKTLAIVGPSGSGKSTLVDLLPRFQDRFEGEITVDGISIKAISLSDLRNKIGIVSQQSVLFNDTVFNNITFGMPNVSQEHVEAAAKIAHAHDFILAMDGGYSAQLSDGGSNLSGGQRQRISIARAVLRNPDILILDEATSALDTESEFLVQEALKTLMKNRTTMIIAHRLSTIQHADEILVLDQGEIVEKGSHQELSNAHGVYRRLVDSQAFHS